jgi:hypothetical protein
MPVVGVDDARARGGAAGRVVGDRREPADEPGLCHVRVHDRRPPSLQFSIQAEEAPHVIDRRDGTAERFDKHDVGIRLQEIAHVAFSLSQPSVKEARAKSERLERRRQVRRLDGWSADVEPGDQPGDGDTAERWMRSAISYRHSKNVLKAESRKLKAARVSARWPLSFLNPACDSNRRAHQPLW